MLRSIEMTMMSVYRRRHHVSPRGKCFPTYFNGVVKCSGQVVADLRERDGAHDQVFGARLSGFEAIGR